MEQPWTRTWPEASTQLGSIDMRVLQQDLRAAIDGEVRFDPGSRGAYSTDASNYRQVPLGVVVPRSIDDAIRALEVCRTHGAPVTSRGGGTSLAGQACNVSVVVDWSKYCNDIVSVDPDSRTCVVEPGIVLDELNAKLSPYGMMFGPRPATHDHCTLGGMIGNNSCGATAQAYGKTVDNVVRLEVLTSDGERFWTGPTSESAFLEIVQGGGRRAEIYRELKDLVEGSADHIRAGFPELPRRVSGYNLDSLLPENSFNVAQLLVGSEGTLVTVLHAELTLVPVPSADSLLVLGFPDIASAADAVPRIVGHGPAKLEGIDDRLVSFEKADSRHNSAIGKLPKGQAWLMVAFTGDSQDDADAKARELASQVQSLHEPPSIEMFDEPDLEAELWSIRESALGATARPVGMPDTWPGWEDSAVPPDRLGDYLRQLSALYDDFGYRGAALYGHFGQGCVHTRIPFDLTRAEGIEHYRRFLEEAADLVVSFNGSLSGEHGDGQARGELLNRMFPPEVMAAFGRLKWVFDPQNLMNPGKVLPANPVDGQLRLGERWTPTSLTTTFAFADDGGRFDRAVLRCVGVGNCRRHGGGVMCPSYMATREEEHSTRGRARLLFEMLQGHDDSPVRKGWRSPEVRDALDLCLSCKGCKQDCPVGVDMATYKAEFLHHHYAGRLRPRPHYSMGWLPLLARPASFAYGVVNALERAPALARAAKWLGGIAPDRTLPAFAPDPFQRRFSGDATDAVGREVLLWPDTFMNFFEPAIGRSAVRVLRDAGYTVKVPAEQVCCGLTWISTGQLGVAKWMLRRAIEALRPELRRGTPIVVLEPSCAAVFRSDLTELLPGDRDAIRLASQVRTFAELLNRDTPEWDPPDLGGDAMVQAHCHQHAVLGFDDDRVLMQRAGLHVEVLDSGCCGLAGNFGFERGHHEVSRAIAERVLLPAVRDAAPETRILADGFSCRTQIRQGDTGRTPVHLAQVLAQGCAGGRP